MALLLSACALILLFSHVSCVHVLLGDSVTFNLTKYQRREGAELVHRLKDDSTRLVATLNNGVWQAGPEYRDRMDGIGSVILINAELNDNGLYEFTYNRDLLHLIQVDVLIPYEVSVTAGETASLPCHAVTSGESVQSLLWEKDGESVLQLHPSGDISDGTDFNGSRVSVSSDWHRRGDLTLTVKEAEPKDEGVYHCSLIKKSSRGNPAVVRLRVGDIIPGPRNRTPPPPPPPPPPPASSMIIITPVLTFLLGVVVGVVVFWLLKSRRCNFCTGGAAGGEEPERRSSSGDDTMIELEDRSDHQANRLNGFL